MWISVTVQAGPKLDELHDVLCFLNAEGMRFYIAAFMTHSIANPNSMVAERTVIFLESNLGSIHTFGFTTAQIKAILAFLLFMEPARFGKEDNWEFIEVVEATLSKPEVLQNPPPSKASTPSTTTGGGKGAKKGGQGKGKKGGK